MRWPKVKLLLEATFPPVFTLRQNPVQISRLEVAAGIDPHQPAIGSWLVADFQVKRRERCKVKLDAAIVVVLGFPAAWIAAPVPLPVVSVIHGVRVFGW